MLFDRGRFIEVDERAPQHMAVVGDQFLFVDHAGALHAFHGGTMDLLDPGPVTAIEGSRRLIAWRQGPALKALAPKGPVVLSTMPGAVTATDSLVVFHDRVDSTLRVWWKNRSMDVAQLRGASQGPSWSAGSNVVLFHDRERRRVSMCHRGAVLPLCDDMDTARVSAGGDLAAYWDEGDHLFRIRDHGRTCDIDPLCPRTFTAGDGVVAYVSQGGAFSVYRDGSVQAVLDHAPTEFWVKDSLVLFMDAGRFMVEHGDRAEVVERYLPEQWHVEQGTLTYLDLDRGIRQWSNGRRTVLAQGFATRRFEVWGDVVVWRTEDGVIRCWWNGRRYEY